MIIVIPTGRFTIVGKLFSNFDLMRMIIVFLILGIPFNSWSQRRDTLSQTNSQHRDLTDSKSDFFIRRADSIVRIINLKTGAEFDMFNYVSPEMFGAKGDGVTDDGAAIQRAVDFCLKNRTRPAPLVFGAKKYHIENDIVINIRDTSVKFNPAQFYIRGAGGAGQPSGDRLGTTIERGGSDSNGAVFRICEEVDGTYPGGGKEQVVNPLNFLRSVVINDINFVGSTHSPLRFSGIVGRGIFSSTIERCNFFNLNYGIRFGKGKTGVAAEKSANQHIDLDYCERNRIAKCNFRNVQYMLTLLNGDISKIEQNFMSGTVDSDGYIMYLAGGNDFYDISNNIIHPRVASTRKRINKAIQFYYVRGVDFSDNHFEDIHNNLFYCIGSVEVFNCRSNLIYGVDTTMRNLFNLKIPERGVVNINNNNMAFPNTKGNTIVINVAGDDTENTKLKRVRLDYSGNKFTTTLGGNIPGIMKTSMDQIHNNYGQYNNPVTLTHSGYLWGDRSGNLRYKKYTDSIPLSDTDGYLVQLQNVQTANTKKKQGEINKIPIQYSGSASFHGDGVTSDFSVKLPAVLPDHNYQVSITPTMPIGTFYISDKTSSFFKIHFTAPMPKATSGNPENNISFDWIVIRN